MKRLLISSLLTGAHAFLPPTHVPATERPSISFNPLGIRRWKHLSASKESQDDDFNHDDVNHDDVSKEECLVSGNDEEYPKRCAQSPSLYESSKNFALKKEKSKRRQRRTSKVSIPSNRDFTDLSFSKGILSNIEDNALRTRLLDKRAYANKDCFEKENMKKAPGIENLMTPQTSSFDKFWISPLARCITFGGACLIFPYIMKLLDRFVTMAPDQLDNITSSFGPGISILYGTFLSLTLSILYTRQSQIQEVVALEAALLANTLRTTMSIFKGYPNRRVEAAQIICDQVAMLVKKSRGVELMTIMYSDNYALLLEEVNKFEGKLNSEDFNRKINSINYCRDLIKDLTKTRSKRLAEEARALPPTHFLILNLMTTLTLLSFCASVLPTIESIGGTPSAESTLIFGLLTTTYILFYNFADDLNDPFGGVYQVRRSTAASHLLEIKFLVANHPELCGKVDFEDVVENHDRIRVRTPGLGDTWFEKDEFYISPSSTMEEQ